MLAKIMKLVPIAALVLAAIFWRSAANYQLLLDSVVCIGALIVAQQAVQAKQYLWTAGFIGMALLFNPIVPVFAPSGRLLLFLGSIAPFAISFFTLKARTLLIVPSITARDPGSQSL
jgi:hypothetical protein